MSTSTNGNGGHSLASYARHRKVSVQAVSKAVQKGRLATSITRTGGGSPRVLSFAAADQEWTDRTDWSKTPLAVREREARRRPSTPSARALRPDGTGTPVPVRPFETTPLENLSVALFSGQDGDQVVIGLADEGEPVLAIDKDTAANLGLRLWITVGGHVDDLPGVKPLAARSRN